MRKELYDTMPLRNANNYKNISINHISLLSGQQDDVNSTVLNRSKNQNNTNIKSKEYSGIDKRRNNSSNHNETLKMDKKSSLKNAKRLTIDNIIADNA